MEAEKIEPEQPKIEEQIEVTRPKKVVSEKQKAALERARLAKIEKAKSTERNLKKLERLEKAKKIEKVKEKESIMPKMELPKMDNDTKNKLFLLSLGIGGIVALSYISKKSLVKPVPQQEVMQPSVQPANYYVPQTVSQPEPVVTSRLRLDF